MVTVASAVYFSVKIVKIDCFAEMSLTQYMPKVFEQTSFSRVDPDQSPYPKL